MKSLGKSTFAWQIPTILGGDVDKIAAMLKAANFQSVILHSETLAAWKLNKRPEMVRALKAVGITPVGGAAVYGADPVSEGRQAAALCNEFGLSAFVFDAESTFDATPNSDSGAVKLIKAFRAGAPGVSVGWCWWAMYQSRPDKKTGRIATWHPKSVLWSAMTPGYGDADFGVPMAYWSWGDSPQAAIAYLKESWSQWRAVTDKPLVPAGRAYIGDGGTATPEAIAAFEDAARVLGAVGVCWWSLQHALDAVHLPGVWEALAKLTPFDDVIDPVPEPIPQPEPEPTPAGLFMVAARFVNIRAAPTTASVDLGDVQPGERVGPIIGIAGGRTGAWAHLADGRYVCAADAYGNVYLVETK